MLGRSRRAVKRLRQQPEAQPRDAQRKRPRGTPPNVLGKGPLLSAPGLGLGVVVMVRNEAPYLEEWLAYHHALGVQHFFIYDNGSTDELQQVIETWVNHGLVTLMHWPLPGGQIDAYSHALRFFGPSLEWLAFFDVDEFLVPLLDDDIAAMLERWPEAADVRVPRKDFGFSGHRVSPDGLTIESYTEIADVFKRDPGKPVRVKTIARPGSISAVGIHTATVADVPRSPEGQAVPAETAAKAVHGVAQLNHYYTRSFEEFEAKRFRGSGTGRINRPAIEFDLPALETDRSALRFAERTRAMIDRMRGLEASPYHYGSELALEQFPRFNDLGLFAEFAIANTAAGEPELRREPGMRLPNQFPGTGFVGHLSGVAATPTRGYLSASVHLGPLLERTRGRIEASWVATPDAVLETIAGATVVSSDESWTVTSSVDGAVVKWPIESSGKRRCYALGFVIDTAAPGELQLELLREDGSNGTPLEVQLDHAGSYAGVVEFESAPDLVSFVTVRLPAMGEELVIYDLFVVSYG